MAMAIMAPPADAAPNAVPTAKPATPAASSEEVPAKTGQFLTFFADSKIALERPNKLHANVTGDVPNFHFYYDGSKVSAFDPEKNVYAVSNAPGTIDEMLPFMMKKAGIQFPAADIL